jgi:hypothetical protein
VRARRAAGALALALAATVLAAGCDSAAGSGQSVARVGPPRGPALLATSLTTGTGTWAVAVMGGSAASHNNFWQLFVRPAGTTRWKLATPPGVADNGGLVMADAGGRSLIAAFRPSQYLTYTPLAVTRDGGQAWATAGPLDAALADDPDALATAPGSERLLALLTTGTIKLAIPGYTRWTTLVTRRALAATAAGRRCGLDSLTAAAFTASGAPMVAGSCSRPGTSGIFASQDGAWQAAGPALPAELARERVAVLRLTRTPAGTAALLEAGTWPATTLLAAWRTGTSGHWALSPPVKLGGAKLTSTSFGRDGAAAIILNGKHAETITGPGGSWRLLPALPAGTATLTSGPAGRFSALAIRRAKLTIWQLGSGTTPWRATQVLKVPIQFGSSG